MSKKIVSLILACFMLCGVAGCGSKTPPASATSAESAAGGGSGSAETAGSDKTTGSAETTSSAETASSAENAGSDKTADSADTAGSAAFSDKDSIEISVATWYIDPEINNRDDLIHKTVREKFNITLKPIVITWDDYFEKILTWMATADAPDLFTIDVTYRPNIFLPWVKDELLRPMPDDLSAYPNLETLFGRPDVQMIKVDGKFWCVPRYKGDVSGHPWAMNNGMYYRKDWAGALGIDEIVTLDDFVAYLRAVSEGDLDGNGATDTVGVSSGYSYGYVTSFIWRAYEPISFGSWQVDSDGKLYRAFNAEHTYDAALALRNLFNEGLIDPDILIQTTDGGFDKFAANKSGAVAFQMFSNDELLFDKLMAANPDKKLEDYIGFLNDFPNKYDGKSYCSDSATNFWAEVYIPHTVDDAKYERIMPFLEYVSSEEWIDFYLYGVEGEDYRREGGKIVFLTEDGLRPNVKEKYLFLNGFCELTLLFEGRKFSEFYTKYPYVGQMVNEYHDWAAANATPAPTTGVTYGINTPLLEEFVDESETLLNKFMYGGSAGDPKAEWDALQQAIRDSGVDAVIAEMNEAVRAAGRLK